MCGRFVSPEEAAIERAFEIVRKTRLDPFVRRFNVYPTDLVPCLRQGSVASELELAAGRWGMVPHWWKQSVLPRSSHIARAEEAAGKPMWRDAWARSRCLIPAEGWYEWQQIEFADPASGEIRRAKQPHFIRRADGRLSCFAGMMAHRRDPATGELTSSCAIVTTRAEGRLAAIHERSPLVLPETAYDEWLSRRLVDPDRVRALAASPMPPEAFVHWKVKLLVNNTKLDSPELIEPAG